MTIFNPSLRPSARATVLLAFFLLAGFVWVSEPRWRSQRAIDFYQFWVVGVALADYPVENIYAQHERDVLRTEFIARARTDGSPHFKYATQSRRALELAGTPFLYACFDLLASGHFDRDYERYRRVTLAMYVLAFVLFTWLVGLTFLAVTPLLFLFTTYFAPFAWDVQALNVNQVQLGAIALILFVHARLSFKKGHLTGGFLTGLLLMFKPNILQVIGTLVFVWIIFSQWERIKTYLVGLSAGCLLGLVVPLVMYGNRCSWFSWLQTFPKLTMIKKFLKWTFLGVATGNRSAFDHNLWNGVFFLFTLAAIWVLRFGRVWPGRFWLEDRLPFTPLDELRAIGIGFAAYLISGPLVHQHYFMFALPLVFLTIRAKRGGFTRFISMKERLVRTAGIAASIFYLSVFWVDPALIARGFSGKNTLLMYASIIGLYVFALADFKRSLKQPLSVPE